MKKRSILIIALLVMATLMGCAKQVVKLDNDLFANKEYQAEGMVNVMGEKVEYSEYDSQWFVDSRLSWGLYFPDKINAAMQNPQLVFQVATPYFAYFGAMAQKGLQFIDSVDWTTMNEDKYRTTYEKIQSFFTPIMALAIVDEKDPVSSISYDEFKKWFGEEVAPFATFGTQTYYLALNEKIDDATDEGVKAIHQAIIDDFATFKENIILYRPEQVKEKKAAASSQANMKQFTTQTMAGNTVSQDVFKDYDITMVNVWATFCGPCIHEMPDLQELYTKLPKNVNMLTLCSDYQGNEATAAQIVADVNGEFEVLIPNAELSASLLNHIQAVPTTVFVDKEGTIVGEFQVGAPMSAGTIADSYLVLIDNALSEIGKKAVNE